MKLRRAPAAVLLAAVVERQLVSAIRVRHEHDVGRALACLRLTTPDLRLAYPPDAERHVEEIYNAMLPWAPNFTETQRYTYHIEDMWMTDMRAHWKNVSEHAPLSDVFGPYVPVFSYWVEPWVSTSRYYFKGMHYPDGMLNALRAVLRKDVPYVTVSQSDMGLLGWDEFLYSEYPNLLVLSAGGYGHAAVPLHKTDALWELGARRRSAYILSQQQLRGPVEKRKHFVSFVGSLSGHGPVRQPMVAALRDFVAAHNNDSDLVAIYHGANFTDVMMNSRFSLVPRGCGRTTYHLAETIQLGLNPIFVYEDMPWVPFPEVYKKFGFQTDVQGLPQLLERLLRMPNAEVQALEEQVAEHAHSHFTPVAEAQQIWQFLNGGGGDLFCQPLPNSSGLKLD